MRRARVETRSVLFSIDLDDSQVEEVCSHSPEKISASLVAGTWTKAKYICKDAVGCVFQDNCKHAKPHNDNMICWRRWQEQRPMLGATSLPWIPYHVVYRGGHTCANCVGIPETRKFIKQKRANLSEDRNKVICPGAIDSCAGRCKHAVPHVKNRYCKDLIRTEGEPKLQCHSVRTHGHGSSRGLIFDTPTLSCHKEGI